jgi:hypothetical protein
LAVWIFKNDSFISVVASMDDPNRLLIRSRIKGDIERMWPEAKVFELEDADYRYRAQISREELKKALCEAVEGITYTNFKNSVPKKESKRKEAYTRVWSAMAQVFGAFGVGELMKVQIDFPDNPETDPDVRAYLYGP